MKKKILSILLVLCLVVLTGCSSKSTRNPEATPTPEPELDDRIIDDIIDRGCLVVGVKTDVPDLCLYDETTGSYEGLEADIAYSTAAKIFSVSLHEAVDRNLVEFVPVTVNDREEKLRWGQIDLMLATYTITAERAEKFSLSDSYYTDYIGVMVLKNRDDLIGLKSLDGKRIGVVKNTTAEDHMTEYIEKNDDLDIEPYFFEYKDYDHTREALDSKEIDAMAADLSVLNGYVDEKSRILENSFVGQHYAGAVKNENAILLQFVNKSIAECIK
ncbi:MAG: transporter substrate-binding domain-containing protein [Clostridia bacterium]|nr:transporter substrate-binding domain-containing protein [Clostridia bacterium]